MEEKQEEEEATQEEEKNHALVNLIYEINYDILSHIYETK